MSPLTEPTTLVLRKTWQPMDPDAAAYITAVEAADLAAGQSGGLEEKTKIAIDNFVLGCKADGIWSAIKASCILAGARTLNGALVPLVGTAPNRFGTEGGWNYSRKIGLQGNGTNNYLNSNRANNADPRNSKHLSVWASAASNLAALAGTTNETSGHSHLLYAPSSSNFVSRINSNLQANIGPVAFPTFYGATRPDSATLINRANGLTVNYANGSQSPVSDMILIYTGVSSTLFSNARLAFYSIGESLDLALLDARVTDLINAIGAAF